MNNTTTQAKTNKVIPLHTSQSFYYWMSKSINRLRWQSITSRVLIICLIIWNIFLTIPDKTDVAVPQFNDAATNQIMIEEDIPSNLEPIPLTELA